MVTLLYQTLQSTVKYDKITTRVMVAGNNFAFKIAAKPPHV